MVAAPRMGMYGDEGRLHARPREPRAPGPQGLHSLGFDPARDSYLYVPASYRAERSTPLVVMLHGAGGHADQGLTPLLELADALGIILLAPASRDRSWDVIVDGYGPDVELIDRALDYTFERYYIDPVHLALAGFSDGASYALSLGLTNGDLFTHIVAFAPGFMAPASTRGEPRIFIAHGLQDPVLPIERCSRRIVPALEQSGYDLTYHEFEGGHTISPRLAREALEWFRGPSRDVESTV